MSGSSVGTNQDSPVVGDIQGTRLDDSYKVVDRGLRPHQDSCFPTHVPVWTQTEVDECCRIITYSPDGSPRRVGSLTLPVRVGVDVTVGNSQPEVRQFSSWTRTVVLLEQSV